METPVTFRNHGQQIIGMLHQPDRAPGAVAGVVSFHGFTGQKQEAHRIYVKIGRELAARNVAMLRFDFRGSGDSEGDFSEATVSGQLDDARVALEFLRARPGIDSGRNGVLGMSLGGLLAAHVLGTDPAVRAAVLCCPLADTLAAIRKRSSGRSISQAIVKGHFDFDGWAVGRHFIKELAASRPLEAIRGTKAHVLIVHGDQDESVPVQEADAYEAALQHAGAHVEKRIIRGAGHTFDSLKSVEEVVSLSVEWFSEYL